MLKFHEANLISRKKHIFKPKYYCLVGVSDYIINTYINNATNGQWSVQIYKYKCQIIGKNVKPLCASTLIRKNPKRKLKQVILSKPFPWVKKVVKEIYM